MEVSEIKSSPGKGLGVFATRPIPRGYRIVCEKPIMTALREPGFLDIHHVYDQFDRLSQEDQDKYFTLHTAQEKIDFILPSTNKILPRPIRHRIAKAVSIFETNGFRLETSTESGTSGVFATTSRFNHSCTPNANQDWNTNIGSLTVHAVKNITVAEEITIPYVFLCSDRRQRQLSLEGWYFKCSCFACDMFRPNWKVSEKRRRQIYRLDQDLNFFRERNIRVAFAAWDRSVDLSLIELGLKPRVIPLRS